MKKKLDKDTALAKISAIIGKHFEQIGRENVEDVDATRQELIEDIDEILNDVEISTKHIIVEKLQLDDEIKEELKDKWKN